MKRRPWFKAAILGLFALAHVGARASELARELSAPSPDMATGVLPFSLYKPAAEPPMGHRWPALYLMHGVNGTQRDWPIMGHVQRTVDTLIAEGRMPPVDIMLKPYSLDGLSKALAKAVQKPQSEGAIFDLSANRAMQQAPALIA